MWCQVARQHVRTVNTRVSFSEQAPGWEVDIQHDVIEECNKHGGVVHIYVDMNSAEVEQPLTGCQSSSDIIGGCSDWVFDCHH